MADSDPESKSGDAAPADASFKVHELGRVVETHAQRIQRLQHEAHALAHEQVELVARDLSALAERAGEIAMGGEAYPVGVRELCSRLAEELAQQAQLLTVILERSPKA